ncbi:MAG: hypothetical protein WBY88_07435 [Desulfosarcina sp.]
MDATLEKISIEIEKLKSSIDHLKGVSQGFPALDRNLRRMAASLTMLELNFVDPFEDAEP